MLPEIHFIIFIGNLLNKFLRFFFQTEGPLIHVLYDELNSTIQGFMRCFIKTDIIGYKRGKDLLAIDINDVRNHLNIRDVDVGHTTQQAMAKLSSAQQKGLTLRMKQFMIKTTEYLVLHFPTEVQQLLRDLSYLHPLMKDEPPSINAIKRIASKVPPVHGSTDCVLSEWKLYQSQEIPRDWFIKSETSESIIFQRIDVYWNKVFESKTLTGGQKYLSLSSVVKSDLCLAHGNAEVERSLSISKRMISSDRTNLRLFQFSFTWFSFHVLQVLCNTVV